MFLCGDRLTISVSEQMKRYVTERQEAFAAGREENDVTERQKKLVAELRRGEKSPKPSTSGTTKKPERNRSLDVFYDSDDDKPNQRVDRIIEKHQKEVEARKKEEEATKKKKLPIRDSEKSKEKQTKRKPETTPKRARKKTKTEPRPFDELFSGVVFTISGIVNPDRAKIRDMALKMGAKYRTNWDDTCTHLMLVTSAHFSCFFS